MSKQKSNWTNWAELINSKGQVVAFYRTNGKKVQVRTPDNIRAEATCNKCDVFDLFFGVNLACIRLENKVIANSKRYYEEVINNFKNREHENKMKIKQLLKTATNKNEGAV